MHSQHNPIAQRIDAMRQVWRKKVAKETVLVRWLLKPEESRMYEGFCRLEASAHGGLPELFIFFYTPFEDAHTYSRYIIAAWIHEVKTNTDLKAMVTKAGIDIDKWDYNRFEPSGRNAPYDEVLIDMMDSFRRLIRQDDIPVVLCLLPGQLSSTGGFASWLHQIMQLDLPASLRLLILDHTGSNYWGSIFEKYNNRAVTLSYDLRLNEAIRQIAMGGDSQNPEVQFRKCMYEMGDAAQNKQSAQLHHWGKKAIEVGTRSGNKNLVATAFITYAGMLFNLKEFATIQSLLDSGIRVCKAEIAAGDEIMKPFLLQFYGFKAAAYQHQKETKQAFDWSMQQGKEAHLYNLYTQSVSGYHKAFLLAQYKKLVEEQVASLDAALLNTSYLHKEEIRNTEYPLIAYEYQCLVQHNVHGTKSDLATLADNRMLETFGPGWQETVLGLKLNFNRQHIEQKEATHTLVS